MPSVIQTDSWQLPFQPSRAPLVSYEIKTCEMCPGHFMRAQGTSEKYCRACKTKLVEQERKQKSMPPWPRIT